MTMREYVIGVNYILGIQIKFKLSKKILIANARNVH